MNDKKLLQHEIVDYIATPALAHHSKALEISTRHFHSFFENTRTIVQLTLRIAEWKFHCGMIILVFFIVHTPRHLRNNNPPRLRCPNGSRDT